MKCPNCGESLVEQFYGLKCAFCGWVDYRHKHIAKQKHQQSKSSKAAAKKG
jgi:hypothetical protein